MLIARFAGAAGRGIVAGFAGTAAMTISSTLEARLRRRGASSAPARAAQRVLGIDRFESGDAERRFGTLVHWAYGSGWGAVRGMLRASGARPAPATVAHFASVWGSELVALPSLDVAPPVTMWRRDEVAIDVWHHLVYVLATAMSYEMLEGR